MKNLKTLTLPSTIALTGLVIIAMIYTGQSATTTIIGASISFTLLCFLALRSLKSCQENKHEYISKLETEKSRIAKMAEFVETISFGNYNANLHLSAENDELLQKLFKMQEKLRTTAEDDLRRNWVNMGLAKFVEILRSDGDLKTLADSIICNLVKYLNANQGGLFVIEEEGDEQYLELKAAYAYDRKKFVDKRIAPGQGLTGQCWIEGDKTLLTDIPDSYINITSGLGESLPKCVLIVPLKVNDVSYGVIELASFKIFETFEIDFVEKLAESIASTISNAKINTTTKSLLEATQQQAEELKSQEEEMRQNMEELQATQEEMHRVSAEMSEQLRVINATIATIEFDLSGIIKDANDNFLSLMGYNKEEVIGKHHKIFVTTEEVESNSYKQFWKDLSVGRSFDGEFKRLTRKGETVWIKGMYSPILNNTGEPVKVVKFAYDITKEKAQQAEMERHLEKVTATQVEMQRVTSEMSEQLRIINSTIATVEFDLSGIILEANSNFLTLMGYDKEEIIAHHHKIFVDDKESKSDQYAEFWKTLTEGKSFNGEFKRVTKSGKNIWIKGMYSPVKNNLGLPVKVVKFAYDITREKEQQELLKYQEEEMSRLKKENS
ncbi:PAS domain S-box protein [Fulvivirga sp. 29W222]|uniref:PAS domain S-box protein n=1 Tax=Fulvivirga marina TaxID=2494733 RepID=A0A937FZ92_9BACT|nr:PAS domain S-box protein [Fulvivirga marina]MBL6447216.1 PAS domain S-box protein [Fulvivirga marina]